MLGLFRADMERRILEGRVGVRGEGEGVGLG